MVYETRTRGRLIADRFRIIGADPEPGRTVAAVDRDAPAASAAVRLAVVDPEVDADQLDVWAATWRSLAERGLVVPLLDVVVDDELGAFAVVEMSASLPVHPGDPAAVDQDERLGAALAQAGLELSNLELDALGFDGDGRLILDAVRFVARSPQTASEGAAMLIDLLGPVAIADPPRERGCRGGRPRAAVRGNARRRVIIAASVVLIGVATLIVVLPDRSNAPASIAPADDDAIDPAVQRALAAEARPAPSRARSPRPSRPPRPQPVTQAPAEPIDVPASSAPSSARVVPDPDGLPLADSEIDGDALPLAEDVGAHMPVDGDGLPSAEDGDGALLPES